MKMAARKTKIGDEEKLDDATIASVIKLLEPEEGKAITKKLACELLHIAYNTTRLGTIIEKYKEKKARQARMRAEKRGKPVSIDEVRSIISAYLLDSDPISSIVDDTYRSADVVKRVLEEYNVPIRGTGNTYFKPEMVPEGAMRTEFVIGEIVYSMRYDSCAKVEGIFPKKSKDGETAYRIWLLSDKWKESAFQPTSELASLSHLKELGIKL